jgi:hypothetical protein
VVDGQENKDAAWYYPAPKPAASNIKVKIYWKERLSHTHWRCFWDLGCDDLPLVFSLLAGLCCVLERCQDRKSSSSGSVGGILLPLLLTGAITGSGWRFWSLGFWVLDTSLESYSWCLQFACGICRKHKMYFEQICNEMGVASIALSVCIEYLRCGV